MASKDLTSTKSTTENSGAFGFGYFGAKPNRNRGVQLLRGPARTGCVVLLATAAMVLTACSSSSSKATGSTTNTASGSASSGSPSAGSVSAGSGGTAAPSAVTIGLSIPTAPFAAIYAAEGTTGAFAAVEKKFGTTVKFANIPNPADATNDMVSGSIDVSFAGLQNYLLAQAAGKNVVSVFTCNVGAPGVLIAAKKDQATRGTDLAKFAGATFGYTKAGSGLEFYSKYSAEKAGLNWDKVSHVAFGSPSASIPLLQAGRLDVAAVDPATAVSAINAGTAYLLYNFADPTTSGDLALQLGTVWAFNKSFTTKYPDLTRALVQAMVAGLDAVKKVADDPAAVLALFPASTQAALSKGWADDWALSKASVLATDGTQTDAEVAATLKFEEANGIITAAAAATASTVVDNQYAK